MRFFRDYYITCPLCTGNYRNPWAGDPHITSIDLLKTWISQTTLEIPIWQTICIYVYIYVHTYIHTHPKEAIKTGPWIQRFLAAFLTADSWGSDPPGTNQRDHGIPGGAAPGTATRRHRFLQASASTWRTQWSSASPDRVHDGRKVRYPVVFCKAILKPIAQDHSTVDSTSNIEFITILWNDIPFHHHVFTWAQLRHPETLGCNLPPIEDGLCHFLPFYAIHFW